MASVVAQLDQVAVGIEQVDGGAEATRPGLLTRALHVADVVERVAEGQLGRPHRAKVASNSSGERAKARCSPPSVPQGASCNVVSGLTRMTENGPSSPSWPKPMISV